MAKYSFELKKKVVNSYLNGEGVLNLLLKKEKQDDRSRLVKNLTFGDIS